MTSRASLATILAFSVLPLAVLLLALSTGAVPISLELLLRALFGEVDPPWIRTVLFDVRLPRVLVAFLVGAALSVSGCTLQGLFRNPLADPSVLGVSSMAALGAVLTLYSGLAVRFPWALPIAACTGALLATVAVSALSQGSTRGHLEQVLLVGAALGNVAVSASTLLLSFSLANFDVARQLLHWLLGGFEGRTWPHVVWGALPVLGGTLFLLTRARALDALLLGEVGAAAVGVDVARLRRELIVTASLLTGITVAVGGVVAFVGLIVPHALRLVLGPLHSRLLPGALLIGGTFVVLCDLIARRAIAPEELRLSVVTASIGAPLFFYLLLRKSRLVT
ncbi:MAG TPA: iron ABC transporter permease [Polyangiaceae bacterium]|nr:iron ABC transporter permease [Polyangiaceae bacterium]